MSTRLPLADRTMVVTGANSGIGKETARALLAQGARVIMVCRDGQRAAAARDELAQGAAHAPEVVLADLALVRETERAAAEISARAPKIDVLINNAGLYLAHRVMTAEGFETQWAVNHLAPFLLTLRLLGPLRAGRGGRVVNVNSVAHFRGTIDGQNLQGERSYSGFSAYARSKLANMLFTMELARRTADDHNLTVNAMHPGGVATGWAGSDGGWMQIAMRFAKPFLRTPAEGADTVVYLAISHEVEGVTGRYFVDRRVRRSSRASRDTALAARMWDETVRQLSRVGIVLA